MSREPEPHGGQRGRQPHDATAHNEAAWMAATASQLRSRWAQYERLRKDKVPIGCGS